MLGAKNEHRVLAIGLNFLSKSILDPALICMYVCCMYVDSGKQCSAVQLERILAALPSRFSPQVGGRPYKQQCNSAAVQNTFLARKSAYSGPGWLGLLCMVAQKVYAYENHILQRSSRNQLQYQQGAKNFIFLNETRVQCLYLSCLMPHHSNLRHFR